MSKLIQMIPKKIFQTWTTHQISSELQSIIDTWKNINPEYEYKMYDNQESEHFIKEYFGDRIYNVYNKIVPGAFKADLWRYCILYKYGGVYVDIDTICLGKLDDFLQDYEFVVPVDLNENVYEGKHNLFNTFIASEPMSNLLENCIKRILYAVENNIIPKSKLDFTGPGLLGRELNRILGLDETTSFVGKEGVFGDIHFLKFDKDTEFVKDTNGRILFQNKNGNNGIKVVYEKDAIHSNNISYLSSPIMNK